MLINSTQKRDWTVLVYQGNGCFRKQDEHRFDTLEMQKLPASDRVTILTQGHRDYREDILDRREIKPFPGSYAFIEPVDTVKGRQNQPAQLADFIRWGMEKYPSRRTCLVIAGFAGGNNGMIADRKAGLMPLIEIRKGLEQGLGDKVLDVLAFDGHWMACIEAAAEFEGTAGLMVASQGRMDSWNYQERLAELFKSPDSDANTLANQFLKADAGQSGTTILELNEVPNVLHWTEVLLQEARLYGKDQNTLDASKNVFHFKDFPSVVEQFKKEEMPGPIKEIAREAEGALEALIVDHCPLPTYTTRGLNVGILYGDPKNGQTFRKSTSWDTFLKAQ